MFVGILWPLLLFWSRPALRRQTSSKGMKICNKHLLSSRITQKSTSLPSSLLQVPAQRSLHRDLLHHPHGIQSPLTCHPLPPFLGDCLSTHVPLWNVSPRSTQTLVCCVLHCIPVLSTEGAQRAFTEHMSGVSQPCEVGIINVPVSRWGY